MGEEPTKEARGYERVYLKVTHIRLMWQTSMNMQPFMKDNGITQTHQLHLLSPIGTGGDDISLWSDIQNLFFTYQHS